MIRVRESLDRGDFVGMLADRTLEGEGEVRLPFLGEPASFALGPFQLAAMLKRPVVLMVGLYGGGRRYDVHFEQLADFWMLQHRNALGRSGGRRNASRSGLSTMPDCHPTTGSISMISGNSSRRRLASLVLATFLCTGPAPAFAAEAWGSSS